MTVFISHSFDDQSEFENVTDWLDRLGVPYWKPAEIKSGASLRGQLRQAIGSPRVHLLADSRTRPPQDIEDIPWPSGSPAGSRSRLPHRAT